MRFSQGVVRHRVLILIVTLALMVPAALGYVNTRVNYDMLDYLPADMDTVVGQNELMEEFGKGAFSFLIVENMPAKDVAALKEKISQVDHVESVLWYDSLADLSVPMELLPEEPDRYDMTLSFMSLLSMIKNQGYDAEQEENFGEITVKRKDPAVIAANMAVSTDAQTDWDTEAEAENVQ